MFFSIHPKIKIYIKFIFFSVQKTEFILKKSIAHLFFLHPISVLKTEFIC